MSRFLFASRLQNKDSEILAESMVELLKEEPCCTITVDNGKEFADHQFIACALKSDFYFADPYSAWQRGSNENGNGLARQYLPRSMDFSTLTDDYLRWVEQRLYNRPRKILGFKTPLEVLNGESINTVANQS